MTFGMSSSGVVGSVHLTTSQDLVEGNFLDCLNSVGPTNEEISASGTETGLYGPREGNGSR